jgi:hypothetical protein
MVGPGIFCRTCLGSETFFGVRRVGLNFSGPPIALCGVMIFHLISAQRISLGAMDITVSTSSKRVAAFTPTAAMD